MRLTDFYLEKAWFEQHRDYDYFEIAKILKKKLSFVGMFFSKDKFEKAKATEELISLKT